MTAEASAMAVAVAVAVAMQVTAVRNNVRMYMQFELAITAT